MLGREAVEWGLCTSLCRADAAIAHAAAERTADHGRADEASFPWAPPGPPPQRWEVARLRWHKIFPINPLQKGDR
jgi:hypothetical protein